MSKIIVGVIIFVVVLSAIFFIGNSNPNGNVISGKVIEEGDVLKIPLSEVSTKAQFYDYEGIEYFVVKAEDRTVKTAFNACDVCYRARKGYSQKGEDMVCNNCGNHYAISGLGTRNIRGGGCWPGYLPSNIEGDYLVIKKSYLEAGRYRF